LVIAPKHQGGLEFLPDSVILGRNLGFRRYARKRCYLPLSGTRTYGEQFRSRPGGELLDFRDDHPEMALQLALFRTRAVKAARASRF
jgi:hypothetical protein